MAERSLISIDAICADVRAMHAAAERAHAQLVHPIPLEAFMVNAFPLWMERYFAQGLMLHDANHFALRIMVGSLRADERLLESA